jgi:hypothetical protein
MLVATLVTLVIVPVLYVVFVEDLHLVRWETEAPAATPHHGIGIPEAGSDVLPATAPLPAAPAKADEAPALSQA